MKNRKLVQQFLAMLSELDEDLAAVLVAVTPPYRAAGYQAIHEFHRAVMSQKQLLRESGYSRARAGGQAFDGKQKLMLVRFDALGASGFFAEMQELPNAAPELGELPKARFGNVSVDLLRATTVPHPEDLWYVSYRDILRPARPGE